MTLRNSLSIHDKRPRRALLLAGLLAVVGTSACDDPFALKATFSTATDTLVAYAMSGTPASFASGYNAGTGAVSRVGPDLTFDVAFDLQTDGKIRVIPARLISQVRQSFGGQVATQQVGLLVPTTSFAAITQAPEKGYKIDSLVVVPTGTPVVMQVLSDACQFTFASQLYAKLVVDSVNAGTRQIYFRAVRQPNCGFRSFQPGVPKN